VDIVGLDEALSYLLLMLLCACRLVNWKNGKLKSTWGTGAAPITHSHHSFPHPLPGLSWSFCQWCCLLVRWGSWELWWFVWIVVTTCYCLWSMNLKGGKTTETLPKKKHTTIGVNTPILNSQCSCGCCSVCVVVLLLTGYSSWMSKCPWW